MDLQKCKQCENHLQSVSDSAVCKFEQEVYYRAIFNGNVVSCPLDGKKRRK